MTDFAGHGVATPEHAIRLKMEQLRAQAVAEVKAGM